MRAAPDRVRILKDEEAEVFDVMLELSLVKIDRVWVNEADIVEALVDRDWDDLVARCSVVERQAEAVSSRA